MSTFKHTMMVVDRMHELCEERGIKGQDRVRRLMMAAAHDVGKTVVADGQKGGLHSDDPPMRFGGHDVRGAEQMDAVSRRLGLSSELRSVMEDACRLHMDVHDLPQMSPQELLDFLSDHRPDIGDELPMGDERASGDRKPISFHRATATELVDLAHADEEGRKRQEVIRLPEESFDVVRIDPGIDAFDDLVDDPGTVVEEVRPEFDRERFEQAVAAVSEAINVSGFEALRAGLCDEHSDVSEDQAVRESLETCQDCRTAGDWVGEQLDELRRERIKEVMDE